MLHVGSRESSPNSYSNARQLSSSVPSLWHLIPPALDKDPLESSPSASTSTLTSTATHSTTPRVGGHWVSTNYASKTKDPEVRPRPKASNGGKYLPPHLRNKQKQKYVPPQLRRQQNQQSQQGSSSSSSSSSTIESSANGVPSTGQSDADSSKDETKCVEQHSQPDVVDQSTSGFVLGGCADPKLIKGSILDEMYIPKKASRLEKTASEAYGSFGGGFSISDDQTTRTTKSSLRWEIGATSQCGVRESNEDSYILTNDLLAAFDSDLPPQTAWNEDDTDHSVGLFGIFDGHCGNQGARFAVEQLGRFIHGELQPESKSVNTNESPFSPSNMESILHETIVKMDDEFCKLCQEEGREWESGATALVAMLANENLVIASLGDCRGFLCRLVDDATESYASDDGWEQLEIDSEDSAQNGGYDIDNNNSNNNDNDNNNESKPLKRCFWREVTTVHSPSAEQEKARIEEANGWITTETEIPIIQFRRMDLEDEDVIGILKRSMIHPSSNGNGETTFTDSERSSKECKAAPQRILHISRVCGELAVSRALGDRDFKADFNSLVSATDDNDNVGNDTDRATNKEESTTAEDPSMLWESPLFLPYPDHHDRRFRGDLVTNTPDFHRIRLGAPGVSKEFLLLACDGLWDVMDADDAVRVVRNLLYRKRVTAKQAAARLAELAIRLGSSDNITVVLVRLFSTEATHQITS
uniref:protein-serine/threonine phosphatase n=1 Tax=Pseudo-nitzschia australis TaxID=44445 RepID=A0A7S4EGI4_9STRA